MRSGGMLHADPGSRHTHVQDGIRRVSTSEKPGTGAVWGTANRPQETQSPVFKPTLTVRPDKFEFCEGQRTRAKIRSNTGFRGRSFARVRGCSVVGGMQTGRRSRPNGTQTGRKAVSSLSPVAPPRADIPPALQRSTLGLSRAAIGSRTGALGMRITPTLTRRWASVWRLCRRRCAPRSTGAPPAPCGRSACAPDRDTT